MKSNTIILVVAVIIVAAGVFWYYSTKTGNEPPLSVLSSAENQAQTRFQALFGELQPISFNTEIFSDARFMALADLATPLTPEARGRLDPFAVVPGVSEK